MLVGDFSLSYNLADQVTWDAQGSSERREGSSLLDHFRSVRETRQRFRVDFLYEPRSREDMSLQAWPWWCTNGPTLQGGRTRIGMMGWRRVMMGWRSCKMRCSESHLMAWVAKCWWAMESRGKQLPCLSVSWGHHAHTLSNKIKERERMLYSA